MWRLSAEAEVLGASLELNRPPVLDYRPRLGAAWMPPDKRRSPEPMMWTGLFTFRELDCVFVSAVAKLLVGTLRERWRVTGWNSRVSAITSAIVLVGRAGRADPNGEIRPPLAAAGELTATVSDGSGTTSWFIRQALAELLTRGEPHTNTGLHPLSITPVHTADVVSNRDPSSSWSDDSEWTSLTRHVVTDGHESTSMARRVLADGHESTSMARRVLADGHESTSMARRVLADGHESTSLTQRVLADRHESTSMGAWSTTAGARSRSTRNRVDSVVNLPR